MPVHPITCCQGQMVCSGCKNLLVYPVGATSICCALCHAVSPVPPPGLEMARLVCRGCHTLLLYSRGATSVQCSCCRTVNSASKANEMAHINCGNCRMLLVYQYGARSVKCTLCNFVTSVGTWRKRHRGREREMQAAMEKLSNMGSAAKARFKICRAKLDEKVEKATVKTVEEKRIAEERRKAAEAEAKRELHEAKARHAAQKLITTKNKKYSHVHGGHAHHQRPLEGGATTHVVGGANAPSYPLASQAYHPGHKF